MTEQPVIKKHKMGRKAKILLFSAIGAIVIAAAVLAVVFWPRDNRFRLDEDAYGKSEWVSIGDSEYNQLIADKHSFVVFVDKPGCIKTADMSDWMKELNFKYYDLQWAYAKNTSLHEYIKYTPSVALVRDGEVVDWLDPDSEEDKEFYDSPEAFREWLKKYIKFD